MYACVLRVYVPGGTHVQYVYWRDVMECYAVWCDVSMYVWMYARIPKYVHVYMYVLTSYTHPQST